MPYPHPFPVALWFPLSSRGDIPAWCNTPEKAAAGTQELGKFAVLPGAPHFLPAVSTGDELFQLKEEGEQK